MFLLGLGSNSIALLHPYSELNINDSSMDTVSTVPPTPQQFHLKISTDVSRVFPFVDENSAVTGRHDVRHDLYRQLLISAQGEDLLSPPHPTPPTRHPPPQTTTTTTTTNDIRKTEKKSETKMKGNKEQKIKGKKVSRNKEQKRKGKN